MPKAMPELVESMQRLLMLPLSCGVHAPCCTAEPKSYLSPCCAADLKALEEEVRAIHKDGLLWGAGAPCACLPVSLRYNCLLMLTHGLGNAYRPPFDPYSGCLSDHRLAYIVGGLL